MNSDGGNTWVQQVSPGEGDWGAVALSDDGNKSVAVQQNGEGNAYDNTHPPPSCLTIGSFVWSCFKDCHRRSGRTQ